ncbi:hypothetical protein BY996DRAFT_565217 [Phakopsora pachyrhizi]|nr:hypothetical protein BY996DRAFT_565217 [Phakopsora pachyrhizi]
MMIHKRSIYPSSLKKLKSDRRDDKCHDDGENDSDRDWSDKENDEDQVDEEEIVLKFLEILKVDKNQCKSEWAWSKMIHRVIALKRNRNKILDPGRRRRSSSISSSLIFNIDSMMITVIGIRTRDLRTTGSGGSLIGSRSGSRRTRGLERLMS